MDPGLITRDIDASKIGDGPGDGKIGGHLIPESE